MPSPQKPPFGLYAEQLSGTAFTAPRHENRRSWLYRLRPSAEHPPFTRYEGAARFAPGTVKEPLAPNRLRWDPVAGDTGVDLIDVSTGGAVPDARIPVAPGYQVPFAKRIRAEADIPTAAVGMITEAEQAEAIVSGGEADAVFVARALLRNPNWVRDAAQHLGVTLPHPPQYSRGFA